MFYPGDPNEERKRRLIDQLMRQQRGGAEGGGFGQKLGHMAGMFGRGFGGFLGAPGMARAAGRMPQLPGQAAPQASQAPPFQQFQGAPQAPNMHPYLSPLIQQLTQPQTMVQLPRILQQYGQQPSAPGGRWGMM